MLRDDVVEAVCAGQFHIWMAETVDEALQLLTGLQAVAMPAALIRTAASIARLPIASFSMAKRYAHWRPRTRSRNRLSCEGGHSPATPREARHSPRLRSSQSHGSAALPQV